MHLKMLLMFNLVPIFCGFIWLLPFDIINAEGFVIFEEIQILFLKFEGF